VKQDGLQKVSFASGYFFVRTVVALCGRQLPQADVAALRSR
jgi:hypothetical protein